MLKAVAAEGCRAVGVEPDSARAARCRAAGLSVVEGRAEAIPLEDGGWDSVIMECVYSLCEPEPVCRELTRVLRPGGRLLLADLYSACPPPAGAACSPLLGRLPTRQCLESELSGPFVLEEFLDLTRQLRQFLLQQVLSGGACALCAEDRAALRAAGTGYGLWIWKKR